MDADKAPRTEPDPQGSVEKVVPAGELFGDRREVIIEYDGERYRLRITRRGKLILQK